MVASRWALQEIITDGRTGLHFKTGDAQDLADKVSWAWSHGAELAAMGREARRAMKLSIRLG